MNFPKSLVDTDIFSAIMRGNAAAIAKSKAYLANHPQLSFSILTRFEILRGLKAKSATNRATQFEKFCQTCDVLDLDDWTIPLASDIYAELYQRGELIGDADILIAATAIYGNFVLATNNVSHFGRIPRVRIDNWMK